MSDLQKIKETALNLKSPLKLHILDYLAKKDASNQEIFEDLKHTLKINYRTTIFEALKDLQDIGLVEKYYDNENNKLKYKLIVKKINIDIEKLEIYFVE